MSIHAVVLNRQPVGRPLNHTEVAKVLREGGLLMVGDMKRNLQANRTNAGGQLMRSLQTGVSFDGDAVELWLGSEAYAMYVEFGTGPHRRPGPPSMITLKRDELGGQGSIERWMEQKGVVPRETLEEFDTEKRRARWANEVAKGKRAAMPTMEEVAKLAARARKSKLGRVRIKQEVELAKLTGLASGTLGTDLHDKRMERLAFLIARKIRRHGTRQQPFIRPAMKDHMPRIMREVGLLVVESIP